MSDVRSDQLLPQSVESEEAVLGSILISAPALYEVMHILKPDDFFIVRHQWIYEAMLNIHRRRDPLDYFMVVQEVEQTGKLPEIGGAAYIFALINKTPSALNVEGYAMIVHRMAVRRGLITAASQIARAAHSDESDLQVVVNISEKALFDVTQRTINSSRIRTTVDLSSEHYDRVIGLLKGDLVVGGIKTHQKALDALLGTIHKGDLVVIGARTGMGKSSWLDSVIMENARRGIKGGLISLEMSSEQIINRFIAAECKIPYQRLHEGRLRDHEVQTWTDAVDRVNSWRLPIDDTPSASPNEIRSILRRMIMEYGIEFLCIDYLQLMNGGRRFENRAAEVSYITQQVKQIAREFEIPILTPAQISRDVDDRRDHMPMLSDLRESGEIEQSADTVIFMCRDSYYNLQADNTTRIQVAKHRHGPTGEVELVFLNEQMIFVDKFIEPILTNTNGHRNGNGNGRKVYGQGEH